jgi:hypothetical protein
MVKDAFKKRVGKSKKRLASEDAGKQFAYFTTKESSGKLTIAPEDDSRPAINKNQQTFGGIANSISTPNTKEKK